MHLGSGLETKDSTIDLAVVIERKVRCGVYVDVGADLAEIYANDQGRREAAFQEALAAFALVGEMPPASPLVYR